MKETFLVAILISLSFAVLVSQNSWSQLLDVEEHCGTCNFVDMVKVDGGFLILMRNVDSPIPGGNWINSNVLKYDLNGDFLWSLQYDFTDTFPYGGNNGTYPYELFRLPNSEFLMFGAIILESQFFFLAKMNINGELLAFHNFGEEFEDIDNVVYENGLFAIGEEISGDLSLIEFNLETLDIESSLPLSFEWVDTYTIRNEEIYFSAKDSTGSGTHKLDFTGNKLGFSIHYGLPVYWSNGTHLMSFEKDTLFVLDTNLNLVDYHLFENYSPFGGTISGTSVKDAKSLNGWGLIIGGSTGPVNAPSYLKSPFLLEINHFGEEVFSKVYPFPELPPNRINAIEEVHDGYIVVVGSNEGAQEDWLIRLDENGLLTTFAPPKQSILLFPNPTTSGFEVSIENPSMGPFALQLFDITGRCILQRKSTKTTVKHTESLDLAHLLVGLYFLEFQIEGRRYSQVVVKE